ncbi:MAG: DUF5722 domain-containing protein [Coriobacteriia bacterium]|nr:DUF5722 domain-containing protein [Coriobacteriia bacterium]
MDASRTPARWGLVAVMVAVLAALSPWMASAAWAADPEPSVVVSVGEDQVQVTVDGVGASGQATVQRFDASEYHAKDPRRGVSARAASQGDVVGTYQCGTRQTLTVDRFKASGQDTLYAKYYVVQGQRILAGPVYATQVPERPAVCRFPGNMKGLFVENDPANLAIAKDLGCSSVTLNLPLNGFILPNEDEDGKPISHGADDAVPFVSNGTTYWFGKSAVASFDNLVKTYSQAGMDVTVVVLALGSPDYGSYPFALTYGKVAGTTLAFNTATEAGEGYWTAAMEFLGSRYSRTAERGFVQSYVIGNEIDQAHSWSRITKDNSRASVDVYMEEYARGLRIAHNALSKYASGVRVCMPVCHYWKKGTGDLHNMVNSYAARDLMDWLVKVETARGNYDWGLAPHPYACSLTQSFVGHFDSGKLPYSKAFTYPVSGDVDQSPMLTLTNLELLQQYLERPECRFDGRVRSVYLTESGVSSMGAGYDLPFPDAGWTTDDNFDRQAAWLAQFYYRAAHLSCVKQFNYYRLVDNPGELQVSAPTALGLITTSGQKKPSYELYKYLDTELSLEVADPYLPAITFWKNARTSKEVEFSVASGRVKSYADVMDFTTNGTFPWEEAWDEGKFMTRSITAEPEPDLEVEYERVAAQVPIMVRATAPDGYQVLLCYARDEACARPLCSFTIGAQGRASGTLQMLNKGSVSYGDYLVALTCKEDGATRVVKTVPLSVGGPYLEGVPESLDLTAGQAGVRLPVTALQGTQAHFASFDESVATVTADGVVSARKVGTATIEVTARDYSGTVLKRLSVNVTVGEGSHSYELTGVKAASASSSGQLSYRCSYCDDVKAPTVVNPVVAAAVHSGTTKAVVSWNAVKGATSYAVYGGRAGKTLKKVKGVSAGAARKVTASGLRKGAVYVYQVRAYLGSARIATSCQAFVIAGGKTAKAGSVTSVTAKTASLALAKGQSKRLAKPVVKVSGPGKQLAGYCSAYRYATSNGKVAVVSSSGTVTAKGAGSCYVYVIAKNGKSAKTKVMVR